MWQGQDAIGRHCRLEGRSAPWLSIVGVVRAPKDGLLAPARDDTSTTLDEADGAEVANAIVGQI